jgi:hypothetical protein
MELVLEEMKKIFETNISIPCEYYGDYEEDLDEDNQNRIDKLLSKKGFLFSSLVFFDKIFFNRYMIKQILLERNERNRMEEIVYRNEFNKNEIAINQIFSFLIGDKNNIFNKMRYYYTFENINENIKWQMNYGTNINNITFLTDRAFIPLLKIFQYINQKNLPIYFCYSKFGKNLKL